MKATILFAPPPAADARDAMRALLVQTFRARGYDVDVVDLSTLSIAFCQGDFSCWIDTPGLCRIHDDEPAIVRAVHDSDAVAIAGPLAFGGHGALQKRAVDRMIGLIAPFFTKRLELTHHVARYEKYPALFGIGWTPRPRPELAATFGALIDANAINMFAPGCGAAVLDDGDRAAWPAQLAAMLADPAAPGAAITDRDALRRDLLAAATPAPAERLVPERVAILIGSAKPRGTSASEHLARSLARRFGEVPCDIVYATAFAHERSAREAAIRIAAAPLFVVVAPLYVDGLPSLVVRALELIAALRGPGSSPARFATLLNCGFPEPEQLRTAIAIARHFASDAGYTFAGALPLGGGGIVTPERDLEHARGPTAHITRALDLAGPALREGDVLPAAAIEAMAESPMPDAVYRLAGDLGFRWQAHEHHLAQRALRDRPLDR